MKESRSSLQMNGIDEPSEGIVRFERLSWKQIDELDRDHTIFFLPISPLEEHGPHLPVGTDLLTAQDSAIASMKLIKKQQSEYTCILLPSLPIGFAGFNTDFPGTLSVSSRIVKKIVYQYGKMLASHGFSYLMICTYHMALGHLKGIYNAMNMLRRKYHMIVCEPWSPVFYSKKIEENEPPVSFDTSNEVHAGFRETSLMKYTHPLFVDKSYKNLPSVFNKKIMTPTILFKSFRELGVSEGYIGTPSKADVSYGKWFFELTVNAYVDAALKMMQHNDLPDLPKKIKRQMNLLFWL